MRISLSLFLCKTIVLGLLGTNLATIIGKSRECQLVSPITSNGLKFCGDGGLMTPDGRRITKNNEICVRDPTENHSWKCRSVERNLKSTDGNFIIDFDKQTGKSIVSVNSKGDIQYGNNLVHLSNGEITLDGETMPQKCTNSFPCCFGIQIQKVFCLEHDGTFKFLESVTSNATDNPVIFVEKFKANGKTSKKATIDDEEMKKYNQAIKEFRIRNDLR